MSEEELYNHSRRFLHREAELLDNGELELWLELLTEDIEYRIPSRVTRDKGDEASGFSDKSYHMNESWQMLSARVERFEKEYAWSENPPSRTRHFVSNIRPELSESGDIDVKNNLMVTRLRGEASSPDIITAERYDTLRECGDHYRLAKRIVYLDNTVMGTDNISFFL